MTNATHIEKDIAFCIDVLDLDDHQIGEMLRWCEKLGGISAEYFCEEFIFECEDEDEYPFRYPETPFFFWSFQ